MKKLYQRLGIIMFPLLLPVMRPVLNRTHRVYVAVTYEGKVLLIKNWLARDTWRLPGGGKSRSETEEEAAIREIKEELRVVINPAKLQKLLETTALGDGLKFRYSIYTYPIDHPGVLPNPYEIVAWDWFEALPEKSMLRIEEAFDLLKERGLV